MNSLATVTYGNAVEAVGAAASAANSATTAGSLVATVGATNWVSGESFNAANGASPRVGDARISQIDFQAYRRRVAGAGTTDPQNDAANWAKVNVGSGQGGTTSTASVTLTAASPAAMVVTPATPGLYVTLPDATTCSKADNLYSVYNAGDFDYGVKDSTGVQLGWIRARTGAMIGLADNATAVGVWAYHGLEKVGVTASYVNSTLSPIGDTIRRIALDANRTCFLFGAESCFAIVYDASTQTWGSATLVRTSLASTGALIGVLSAANQVLVCSSNNGTAMETVTLTITGTTVTVNTPVATTLAGTWATYGQMIVVGSSLVLSYVRASNTSAIRAITVSGTAPTVGAENVPFAGAVNAATLFSSGSIVRVLVYFGGSLRCAPYTVSGSTLSAGTSIDVPATTAGFRAFLNGNGNIVAQYANSTMFATIFKLTGTVEAASSASLGMSGNIGTQTDCLQVTASKTVFAYGNNASTWYANILTDTGGTASVGTELAVYTQGVMSYVMGVLASGNTARFLICTTASNGVYSHISLNCSGASPTLSSAQHLSYFGTTSGGITNATPMASDVYGVRPPRLLIASTRAHVLGGSVSVNDLSLTPGSFGLMRSLPVYEIATNMRGVAGAASNESFIAAATTGLNIGFAITRVEAAA